jgi:hypothetical protein
MILKRANNMAISNEIFEHYRIKQREVKKAKNLLLLNGYSVKKITGIKINNN